MAQRSNRSFETMKERRIEMTCPACGHVFQMKRDTLAVAGISAQVEEHLEDETYFRHECQHCHTIFSMEHPFLFRDPKKKYILVLSGRKNPLDLPADELVVRCKNTRQFVFAYRVLSRGLDLAVMIGLKQKWEQRYGNQVRFLSYDPENHCLWIEADRELKAWILTKEEEKKLLS